MVVHDGKEKDVQEGGGYFLQVDRMSGCIGLSDPTASFVIDWYRDPIGMIPLSLPPTYMYNKTHALHKERLSCLLRFLFA